jgi:ornithine cyclodeaminase/alanine dehydrogenase-like protein (mu-crystallin family)
MTTEGRTGLRYLSADDVTAAMPPIEERLALAERTMVALADGSGELPAKIGIHPRPTESFAHAMPAALLARGDDAPGADLIGMKWIAGVPANRAAGLPAIHGLVIVNDPATGIPRAILDAGPITAERTAAVSGVALRAFRPVTSSAARVTIVGAGVQCRSHLAIVGHVLPGAAVTIVDRHPDRAAAVAAEAAGHAGIGSAATGASIRDAVREADVVITATSFAPPDQRQVMTPDWLGPDALVIAVDYATIVSAELARDAALFLTDHREQFLANRDTGTFAGYPDPTATIGEALLAGTRRPGEGRVVVSHLGVGLADLVFADAILRRAETLGLGQGLAT